MAARWSALALLGQLLLAAAVAATLAARSALSGPAIAALVVVELYGVALLLAATPLALGCSMTVGIVFRGRVRRVLRALCSDALAFEAALGRMALEPWREVPDRAADSFPAALHPVLLVHGFGCSGAVWRPLLAKLRAAGVGPVRAVSLEPPFAGLESFSAKLLGELEALGRGGGHPITIVAHSMGGLVARAALRSARPGLIGRIITLGAPHHGTALACWFPCRNARQMCPGSGWLENLNACQEGRLGIPVTTLYSLEDNYIVPARSARLDGARAVELQGIGHLGLLVSKTVFEHVLAELLA